MAVHRLAWAGILGTLGLSACVLGDPDRLRPRDLSPSWLIDRPRLLAVRAEPPEAAPGEAIAFSGLLADPFDELGLTVWIVCPPEQGVAQSACGLDPEALEGEVDPARLEELGIIGVEPGFSPQWTPPEDLLAGLSAEDQLTGLQVTVSITGLPASLLTDTAAPEDFDFNQVESGFKRFKVSTSPTPNQTPQLAAWTVGGTEVDNTDPIQVRAGQTFEVGVLLAEDAIQTYSFTTSEGVVEERVEEPFVRWYATSGEVLESITLHPYLEASWVAPEAGVEGSLWAVLLDRRGGMSWSELRFVAQ